MGAHLSTTVRFGILGAHTYAARDFSEHDVAFLEAVANILASALARQAAETEAEQTHQMLEAVIEGTSDDVFVKDLDGRFLAVNAKAAEMVGRPREELIGRTLHEVFPQRTAETFGESDRLVLERGTVETFEETVTRGEDVHVFLTTKGPYRACDGTLLGTFGIARDITVRKTQEQELARSEERFRLAQEGARMGTWEVDLVSGLTTWSDGLRTLYGVGPDHPVGFESIAPLLHPGDRERVTREVEEAYTHGTDFELECRIIRPDGELRWILARSSSLRDAAGTAAQGARRCCRHHRAQADGAGAALREGLLRPSGRDLERDRPGARPRREHRHLQPGGGRDHRLHPRRGRGPQLGHHAPARTLPSSLEGVHAAGLRGGPRTIREPDPDQER